MDRRTFLRKGVSLLTGVCGGLSAFSSVRAGTGQRERSVWPRIALIIDDIGYSRSKARQFYRFGIPITFSVLPRLPYSAGLANEIYGRGQEIMLHQPMEPYNATFDPGPGALYIGYRLEQIVRIISENIAEVPFITGVNNHMGSRFTSSQKEIGRALRAIRHQGLFFIDSVTSRRSKAYQTARRLRMAAARRDVFLDNQQDESQIMSQLLKLKDCAQRYGNAIGIGHPYPETARALGQFLKYVDLTDVSFVHVSRILYT